MISCEKPKPRKPIVIKQKPPKQKTLKDFKPINQVSEHKKKDNYEFAKGRAKAIERATDKAGRVICEYCNKDCPNPHAHHIIFRSQAPRHKNLHHPDNLLVVHYDCHDVFHDRLDERIPFVIKRELRVLGLCRKEQFINCE